MRERAQANAARFPWAAELSKGITERAGPWMKRSDDELWGSIFGPEHLRSHMVWSSGYCPACRRPVPMYDWKIDAWNRPWKVQCPHCRQFFPKNDYHSFYRSGLNEHGVFDPAKANRALLFNAEHPDPADPLYRFGVDDGDGYTAEGHHWYFIGAYMQYGQFRELILSGIENLAAAYVVSGDVKFAHKAAILLDRLADIWPEYDFAKRGLVYEHKVYGGGTAGYVTYSIDSAWEVTRLTMAYDQIFDALRQDRELVSFLAEKAKRYKLDNPKSTTAEIQRNIETRILGDALRHPEKIRTNYPGTEAAIANIQAVLGWPGNREEILNQLDAIVAKSTTTDGLSGEKGLTGYATIAPRFLTTFLESYARVDAGLLPDLLRRNPKLRQTYHFHTDLWLGHKYAPLSGDCGSFASQTIAYMGAPLPDNAAALLKQPGLPASGHSFFWRLYKATGEPFYLQVSYDANAKRVAGLPYDLFAADPQAVERDIRNVIRKYGERPEAGSVNKQEWRIGMLRSSRHPERDAVWMDYDSIPLSGLKNHFHYDAMNIGLFARGLDLLPEFGYPAVQFGDWHTPQARWHLMTAAHNTVVVDGNNQPGGPSTTTLWAVGERFRAMRASSPAQYKGSQYERTIAMVELPESDFYVIDLFRVAGGADHAKFLRSHFSTLATTGLNLTPASDYGHGTLMRNFRTDTAPKSGWSAVWTAQDRRGYLPPGTEVRLRYTDLTRGAEASTAESWSVMDATSTEEFYVPTIMLRRRSAAGALASVFLGVIEPFGRTPAITSIRRLDLQGLPDSNVAVECTLASGGRDLWIAGEDTPRPLVLVEKSNNARVEGQMAFVRWAADGSVERIVAAKARSVSVGDLTVELRQPVDYIEMSFGGGKAMLVSGGTGDVRQVTRAGKPVSWKVQPRSHRSSQP
ncbi:MAG: heparinase II/III family protein [Bryobacterales bacterium]|nr:heparinase II/III family protein [Bryobacterales bacterium]